MGNAAMQYRSLSLITLALGLLALASARSPYRRAEYFHDFDDYLSVRPADLYAQKLELDHLRREVAQERAMLRDMNFQRLHAGHQYQQQPQQPQPQQPQPQQPQHPQQPQPPQPQQPQQQPKQAPTSCSSCGLFSFFVTLAFGTLVSKALFHGPCFLMGALPWVVLLALKLFFFSFLAATIFVPLLSFLGFLLWAAPLPAFLVALFFLPDFKCVPRKWGSCGPRRCTATDSNNNAATEGSSLPATPLPCDSPRASTGLAPQQPSRRCRPEGSALRLGCTTRPSEHSFNKLCPTSRPPLALPASRSGTGVCIVTRPTSPLWATVIR